MRFNKEDMQTPPLFLIIGIAVAVLVVGVAVITVMRQGEEPEPSLAPLEAPSEPVFEEEETIPESELPGGATPVAEESEGTQDATEEIAVPPSPPPTPVEIPKEEAQTQPQTFSATVEADDNDLYPQSVTVPRGATVTITFKVRSTNVYFGGLDFRSSKFSTASVAPGGQASVTFTADATFSYASYWPASGNKKADGTIVVQ